MTYERTQSLSQASPSPTLQDKLDEILELYKRQILKEENGQFVNYERLNKKEATQAILTALEAWVTSAMPEKREEKLYATTVALTGREWNEALDQYHTKLMEGLRRP